MKKIIFKIILIITALPLLSCLTSTGYTSRNDFLKAANSLTEELSKQDFNIINLVLNDDKYYVPAEINDYPVTMMVDTGFTFSTLKLQYFKDFKMKKNPALENVRILSKPVFDKTIEMFPAVADSLSIGDLSFSPWPFLVRENSRQAAVLGTEFMHTANIILICNPGIMCLSNTSHAGNPAAMLAEYSYKEIDLISVNNPEYNDIFQEIKASNKPLKNGALFAPVTLNGISGYALIDTGSPYTIVDSAKFDKNIFGKKMHYRAGMTDSSGTTKRIFSVSLDKFMIGSYNLNYRFEAAFLDMNNQDFTGSGRYRKNLGIIGLDILLKHDAIIDFGNQKLYLR